MDPDDDLDVSTDEVGSDNGSTDEQTLPTVNVGGDNTGSQDSSNTAWNAMLEKIPAEFHSKVRPDLEQWDKNYSDVTTKYKPYEQFLETDPNVLAQGRQLLELIEQNPQAVYERLGQHLGLSQAQVQQAAQQSNNGQQNQNNQQQDDPDNEEYVDPRDKQLSDLQQNFDAMQNFIQQQVQQGQEAENQQQWNQAVSTEAEKLDTQIQQLKTKDPNLNESELIRRAVADQQLTGNFDLAKSYSDMVTYESGLRGRPLAGSLAPVVMPTTGGTPSSGQKNMADLNEKERMQVVGQFLGSLNQ